MDSPSGEGYNDSKGTSNQDQVEKGVVRMIWHKEQTKSNGSKIPIV